MIVVGLRESEEAKQDDRDREDTLRAQKVLEKIDST